MSEPGSKRTFQCPRCGKEFTCASVGAHKPFPFCSSRCRDVDLGNWLIGKYAIPGAPASSEASAAEEEEEREEKEEQTGLDEAQEST